MHPNPPEPVAPDPLSAVLGLYNALVTVLARPASVEAMLQDVIETLVDRLGGTGGAIALWHPGEFKHSVKATCGALQHVFETEFPHPPAGFAPEMPGEGFARLGAELGRATAEAMGLSLLGTTSWMSHRGEYGFALLVGPPETPAGGRAGGHAVAWRQDALAAAAGLAGHAMERMRLGDEMAGRLAELDARWAALYDVAVSLTRDWDRDRFLGDIVQRAIELLHARGGVLTLLDEATGDQVIVVADVDGAAVPEMLGHRSAAGEGIPGRVIASGEPVILFDHRFPVRHNGPPLPPSATVAAPLFVQGTCAGVLSIAKGAGQPGFSRDDMQTLVLLAQHAGALLTRTRVRQQDEQLMIHRERTRLARELHDGLAQHLASLLLKAEVCGDLARGGAPELRAEIESLAAGLQRAIRETRDTIFSLHDPDQGGCRLPEALRLLVGRFEEQTGRQVALTTLGDASALACPGVEMALLGVAQEALANVRKHAGATEISVVLDASCPKSVQISVQDNGCGFDPVVVTGGAPGHYGLPGMRSRVQELGGVLTVETGSGCGATITATLPVLGSGRTR